MLCDDYVTVAQMSSKKVPYHKHREAEEARKKVRGSSPSYPFHATLLFPFVLGVHVLFRLWAALACEEGGR